MAIIRIVCQIESNYYIKCLYKEMAEIPQNVLVQLIAIVLPQKD